MRPRSYPLALVTALLSSACHPAPKTFGVCPTVGPASRLTLTRSVIPDSTLVGKDSAQWVVVVFGWFGGSTARSAPLDRGIIEMTSLATHWSTRTDVVAAGNLVVPASDSSDKYMIKVSSVGFVTFQDTVVVRRGYIDTVRVSLQGMIFCA